MEYIFILPIVFMIHEFEEMIMLPTWLRNNKTMLCVRFPFMKDKVDLLGNEPVFALVVLEEFLLISACTIVSISMSDLMAWICCLIAFSLHLIVHIIQFLLIRKYIPVIVTSVLCLPYCIWAFIQVKEYYTLNEMVFLGGTGVVASVVNLLFMHKVSPKLWNWMNHNCKNEK